MRLGLGLGLGESRVQFEIPEFVRQVRKKTVPEDLELKAPLPTWCVGVGVLSVLLGVEVGCHQSLDLVVLSTDSTAPWLGSPNNCCAD